MGVFRWEGVGEELDGAEEAKTIIRISLQEKNYIFNNRENSTYEIEVVTTEKKK